MGKTINFDNKSQFDVKLNLDNNSGYTIDVNLKNKTSCYSTTMLSTIKDGKRNLQNQFDVNNMHISKLDNGISPSYDEYEPNDSFSLSTRVWNNIDAYGTMSSGSDNDYFRMVNSNDTYANIKQKVKVNVWLGNVCSTGDSDLYLLNSSGTLVGYKCSWSR